jgi:uridine phosphorylase
MYAINPEDVEREAKDKGVSRSNLDVPRFVVFTFSKAIVDELVNLCRLQEWDWAGASFSPYSSPSKCFIGHLEDDRIGVVIPPMGASPLVALCEEMIYFGAEIMFLACASWGLGEKFLQKGQIHLPSFAVGIDGTSPHYGNKDQEVVCETWCRDSLATALDELEVSWKEGGVGSCEAIYHISNEMVDMFRNKGCLSLENGETASLYSLAKWRDLPIGVLLQPYIDLEQGWKISYLDEVYVETCKIQANAVYQAAISLL